MLPTTDRIITFSTMLMKRVDVWLGILSVTLLLTGGVFFHLLVKQYQNAFFPEVYIDGQLVSGKTKAEAAEILKSVNAPTADYSITLKVDDISLASSSSQLARSVDSTQALEDAYKVGRADWWTQGIWRLLFTQPKKIEFSSHKTLDKEKVTEFVTEFSKKVNIPGEEPKATLLYSESPNSLRISPGKIGREVMTEKTIEIVQVFGPHETTAFAVPVASTSTKLSEAEVTQALERGKKVVGKQLVFRADNVTEHITDQDLVTLLHLPNGYAEQKIHAIVDKWGETINRPAQEAELEYDKQTLVVSKFLPPRKGLALNSAETYKQFVDNLQKLEDSEEKKIEVQLAVTETAPQKDLAETNDLGIKERVGFGESQYYHSIPNRIHNVALTAKKVNNIIVKPGEEFSFNNVLGEVSGATGFRQAYVIKNGRTELGDGGGVCQVSTTLFRALLNGGLNITKRKPHSYRVSYYELNAKPGIDATVFAGEVDLRFINDTPGHILIHTQTDSEKLYMTVELFGTSDGRSAEIIEHKTWDFVGAPAPLYIDDPTIPRGRIRQIDFAASGIKASFKNVIKDKSGNIMRTDEYFSNYRPWRAVFLRGV